MPKKTRQKSTVTINDVAEAAGVSRATASRVLGRYGSVSDEAAEAVRAAARKVGYRVNTVARSMITGRTNTIGVVLPDVQNSFFVRTLRGASDLARERGYDVLLSNTDEKVELEREAVELMRDRRVDGLLVCPADPGEADYLQPVQEADEYVVLLDRSVGTVDVPCVGIDNRAAGYEATRVLLEAGHRRIAFVSGLAREFMDRALANAPDMSNPLESPSEGRAVGHCRALLEAGIAPDPSLLIPTSFTHESVRLAVSKLLDSGDNVTAILTTDSLLTLGALRGIQTSGWSVPEDISLVGFDDADWIMVVEPQITVLEQPAYEIGAMAARLLIDRIDGKPTNGEDILLPTKLIKRHSVGPPRAEGRDK